MRALIGIFLCSTVASAMGIKTVEYERHEFHGDPERRSAKLPVFVYDIPYFGACGIFPPLQIINQIFQSGGSEGGMSPGATWQPFNISSDEYQGLVEAIASLDPGTLGETARYSWVKYEFDSSFDQIPDWESWLLAVCEKHRDSFQRKQSGA